MAKVELSDQAILTSVRALILQSKIVERKLEKPDLGEGDAEYFGEFLQTLDSTLGEFEEIYKERQKFNPNLTDLEFLYSALASEDS